MKWIVANLKETKLFDDTINFIKIVKKETKKTSNQVVVCPSYPFLQGVCEATKRSKIMVGAQDISQFDEGAHTGEVSAKQVYSVGARAVILGHSERRNQFFEDNKTIAKKIKLAQNEGMICMVCLSIDGKRGYEEVLKQELKELFRSVSNKNDNIIVVWEPASAIGTGNSLSPEELEPIMKTIKTEAEKVLRYKTKVMYGGSVNLRNIDRILALNVVDGVLVGSATKNPHDFAKICMR